MNTPPVMLKKIPTQQVKLGMYLQSMEGAWLSHPFWKTKFVLHSQADLNALLASGVPAVWIDVSKGGDVAEVAATPEGLPGSSGEPARTPEIAPNPVVPGEDELPTKLNFQDEMVQAAAVVNRSRQAVTALFGEARLGKAIDTEQCLPVVEEIASSVSRNPSALISLARLKTKDDYTYMHSVAVCALMVSLSKQLGLSEAQSREAGLAGLLHDVGKMMMPITVLNKPGKLTDAEFDVMRSHPVRGYEALKVGSAVPLSALDVCLHHHEKMDGSGYPYKLRGEDISLLARMGAVCDVYDAITSTRPYKAAWGAADSIQRMAQWAGHFDPAVFKAFVLSVGIYPVGTLVRLQSGRLAVVVDQNPGALTMPVVRVFFSTKSKMPIPVLTLDLAQPGVNDRVVGRESAQEWGFNHLDDFWRKPDVRA